jgi:hypothetical protein
MRALEEGRLNEGRGRDLLIQRRRNRQKSAGRRGHAGNLNRKKLISRGGVRRNLNIQLRDELTRRRSGVKDSTRSYFAAQKYLTKAFVIS